MNGDAICSAKLHNPIGIGKVKLVLRRTKRRPPHVISGDENAKIVADECRQRSSLIENCSTGLSAYKTTALGHQILQISKLVIWHFLLGSKGLLDSGQSTDRSSAAYEFTPVHAPFHS